MISKFIEVCNQNKTKPSIIHNNKIYSYQTLLDDIKKMMTLFKSKGLKEHDKVVLFIPLSYKFYMVLLASMMYKLNIVVIDSFKDQEKLDQMIKQSKPKMVLVTPLSKLFSKRFKNIELLNVKDYQSYTPSDVDLNYSLNDIILTTFTSGTTRMPKMIERSYNDLSNQIKVISQNVKFRNDCINLCMLPIYVLFSLFSGITVVIDKKVSQTLIDKYKIDTIQAPLKKLLTVKSSISNIKNIYIGGAILYRKEAKHLKTIFPAATFTYVYGASEGVLIGQTTLNEYLKDIFSFSIIEGVNVSIDSPNEEGVGEIIIQGDFVLTKEHTHYTGDIGKVENNKIYVYGRKKYSCLEKNFYNYITDNKLLEENNCENIFTFSYNNVIYVAYSGSIKDQLKDYCYLKFKKIPVDIKHQTKADYNKIIKSKQL
ncbi:MAG: AMP-binding protein [Bacilli bacterium]|nr:AMP-binding protein [Bacilli bacterium]